MTRNQVNYLISQQCCDSENESWNMRVKNTVPIGYYKRGWMHLIYDFFGIGTFQPILIKNNFK